MVYSCKGKCGSSAFPYVFAYGILIFIYYVFVFRFAWGLLANNEVVRGVVSLILFHFAFCMCQASYFQCTYTDPGGIPLGFPEEYETKEQTTGGGESPAAFTLTVETNKKGERRKCEKCSKVKPDRSHHCSICKRCILKMDHHCPWVNNCVGFHNYKFFLLFLFWVVILAVVVAACLLMNTIDFFSKGGSDILIVALFIIAIVFGFGLAMFAGTHFAYVFKNQTTIEALEKSSRRKENIFNLGARTNFLQVFGTNPWLWFVPVYTSLGNGLWFEQKYSSSLSSGSEGSDAEDSNGPLIV